MYVAIALTEDSTVSTVAGAYDLIDYGLRTSIGAESEAGLFAVAPRATDKFRFMPTRLPNPTPRADWIFVPALEVDDHGLPSYYRPLLDWLCHSAEEGAMITSVGTGAFLLAEAGLLDGREAVTHSNFTGLFNRCYPKVQLRTDTEWVESDNLLLSGNTAWYEAVLTSMARLLGTVTARQAAAVYALDWHQLFEPIGDTVQADPVIARAKQWLSHHFHEQHLVERCARELGLSRRTLNRRFKNETGINPMAFVLRARIQASQNLLTFTTRSIEAIGYEVGYQDITTFRKLFRRSTGMPPGKYRRSLR